MRARSCARRPTTSTGVAAWARAALGATRSDPWLVGDRAVVAAHVEDALAWVNAGPGGAWAVADEIDAIARGLAETVRLLEDAERGAQSIWARLWGAFTGRARREVAAVEGAAVVASESLSPIALLAAGGPAALDPLPPPEPTALLDSAGVEGVLGAAHDVPMGLGPWSVSLAQFLTAILALQGMDLAERLGNPHGLAVMEAARGVVRPPEGVADLVARVGDLYPGPGEDPGVARVAVERVDSPDGSRSWIVEIPGTQDFLPRGGSNPFDLVADLQMMAGGVSDVMVATADAMGQAGIAPGEPVMLVGHSLGGIAAMALASNRHVVSRFDVRSVVTAGSPVARFDVDPAVSVLSLENSTDVVSALDGAPNPDRPSWVTATHDLRASGNAADRAAAATIVGSHDSATYRRTGALVDASTSTSAHQWRAVNAGFLADDHSVSVRTTYEISRGTADATIASVADRR